MIGPIFADTYEAVLPLLEEARQSKRVAVDVESNGMYVYAPQLCTVQLAWESGDTQRVAVIDTLSVTPALLAPMLESDVQVKVLHDLAFDARLLRRHGIRLAGVRDTSVMAAYLGVTSTGLASVLESQAGIVVSKGLQTADWGLRPLPPEWLGYLAGDVAHLIGLADLLWARVAAAGIADEVETETAYRLERALEEDAEAPPWVRIRGTERLDSVGLAVLIRLAEARERLACARNVPLYRVIGDKQLLALAMERPRLEGGIRRVLSAGRGARDAEVIELVRASIAGAGEGVGVEEQRHQRQSESIDRDEVQRRQALDRRLVRWREAEAERRGVPVQVVLPTHCLKQLVVHSVLDAAGVRGLPGMGTARSDRYGEILAAMVCDTHRGVR